MDLLKKTPFEVIKEGDIYSETFILVLMGSGTESRRKNSIS